MWLCKNCGYARTVAMPEWSHHHFSHHYTHDATSHFSTSTTSRHPQMPRLLRQRHPNSHSVNDIHDLVPPTKAPDCSANAMLTATLSTTSTTDRATQRHRATHQSPRLLCRRYQSPSTTALTRPSTPAPCSPAVVDRERRVRVLQMASAQHDLRPSVVGSAIRKAGFRSTIEAIHTIGASRNRELKQWLSRYVPQTQPKPSGPPKQSYYERRRAELVERTAKVTALLELRTRGLKAKRRWPRYHPAPGKENVRIKEAERRERMRAAAEAEANKQARAARVAMLVRLRTAVPIACKGKKI
ncbi:hypothetical protein B0H17DRAFT_1151911 [Mycena rosella]|uniref:Uncharacterized protein n=1 Tax=Mycena rosella TaxID=1033263 RepID=A0AAD7FIH4_MYCRO|nr:hypothetical protein B0H17DRAFT_1151911 [Mycena rosella]